MNANENCQTWIEGGEEMINYSLSKRYRKLSRAIEEVPDDIFEEFEDWELVDGKVLYARKKIGKKIKYAKCSTKFRGIF
jgi:hypothetical protein